MKEDAWYYDDVMALSERGVISGDGSGQFSPTDKVTREQFLKMLLAATKADTDEAENIFADVENGAWYVPYVLTAKKLGIVSGISDSHFGIGMNITRQDMAVMISRTLVNLDAEAEGKEVSDFADNQQISDYAKEAVSLMKSIGLIEGYNNEYRPQDNLTRAEAAKVIATLLKLINNV